MSVGMGSTGGPAVTTGVEDDNGVTVLTVGGKAGCGVADGTDLGDIDWIVGMLVGSDGGSSLGWASLGWLNCRWASLWRLDCRWAKLWWLNCRPICGR